MSFCKSLNWQSLRTIAIAGVKDAQVDNIIVKYAEWKGGWWEERRQAYWSHEGAGS